MKSPAFSNHSRRTFLKYLAGSPYVAALGGIRAFAERAPEIAEVMADPKEAFSVMDFEEATRHKVDRVHWSYLASGVDDDATLRANAKGSSASSCDRAGFATRARSICGRTCSARCTTAPYSPALPRARNFFVRMASSR